MRFFLHDILPGIPVYCSKHTQIGVVEDIEERSLLKISNAANKQLEYIPLDWITATDENAMQINHYFDTNQQTWLR